MANKSVLQIATAQFPVSGDITRNTKYVREQVVKAAEMDADVLHFSETALSGYAGVDVETWKGYDWERLRDETAGICALAREHKLWIILGSSHRLSGKRLPHNSLYVIDPRGRVVERYDKCFCTGGDLKHYSPGNHLPTVRIRGVQCGFLICYDVRFPELYRKYKQLGVQCIFHSFYNARKDSRNIHSVIMPPTLQARAASNYLWISANNSSAHYQSWPSCFITPDGRIQQSLPLHRSGVMLNTVDTGQRFYDAAGPYRERAMKGTLHSGRLIKDPRSDDRTCI